MGKRLALIVASKSGLKVALLVPVLVEIKSKGGGMFDGAVARRLRGRWAKCQAKNPDGKGSEEKLGGGLARLPSVNGGGVSSCLDIAEGVEGLLACCFASHDSDSNNILGVVVVVGVGVGVSMPFKESASAVVLLVIRLERQSATEPSSETVKVLLPSAVMATALTGRRCGVRGTVGSICGIDQKITPPASSPVTAKCPE